MQATTQEWTNEEETEFATMITMRGGRCLVAFDDGDIYGPVSEREARREMRRLFGAGAKPIGEAVAGEVWIPLG